MEGKLGDFQYISTNDALYFLGCIKGYDSTMYILITLPSRQPLVRLLLFHRSYRCWRLPDTVDIRRLGRQCWILPR
jgi:hypothetical protein